MQDLFSEKGVPMAHQMSQFKATADAHMRRDLEAGGKWVCGCEPCQQIRSLIGMEKALDVRPLVREIRELEERLQGSLEDSEKRRLLQQYLKLYDKLAAVMAK
jgi:hypothetical protein